MSKNKPSSFKESGIGLFGNDNASVQKTQEVQEEQYVHEVHEAQEYKRAYGTTQGRKGQHAKRINMAFSDENHTYITKESRRQGISATAFVNLIIDEYKAR